MKNNQLSKQIVDVNRAYLDNAYDMLVIAQNQAVRWTTAVWGQTNWLPTENLNIIMEWCAANKKRCENLKKHMDADFNRIAALFVE